ncbi:DNA polymerase III subunit delta' [Desemzia sp. FAM 23991]|uniref:DNA polymerase III subunit delta' n=1 Tax=unclassified Desemzia TaxID=2685243 RepID=UPI003888BC8E
MNRLQPVLMQQFQQKMQHNKLAHAYLFEGAKGTGKKELALWIAAGLFCPNKQNGIPCTTCQNCTRVFEQHHPDVVEVEPEGLSIKVEQIRYLKSEFGKSGVEGNQKVFIVSDVEKMTVGAANSLLKFLEEPSGNVTAFLLTTAKQRILPTILSRCQLIHFSPLPKDILQQELEDKGVSKNQAALLVHLTNDIAKAHEMSQDEWFMDAHPVIWKWFLKIAKKDKQSFVFVQTTIMNHFKERSQYQLALELLLLIYRDALRLAYDAEASRLAFPRYQEELTQFVDNKSSKIIISSIEEILASQKKLESNVNAQGIFEQLAIRLMNDASRLPAKSR